MNLDRFYQKYPADTVTLSGGKEFVCRYHKNPEAAATLVLLTGGIGLSDMFWLHFDRFARDFSVLTFDYQIQFADNAEFAGAVAELLQRLQTGKVWLVGQSLGGIVAQIIASRYPDVAEGLVLSNTCSLAKDMSKEAYDHLLKMIENQKKFRKLLAVMPFFLFKRLMRRAVLKKKTENFTAQEGQLLEDMCGAMMRLLTRRYEYHMIDFLVDAQNYFGMTKSDFARLDGRVLLILSEDDTTFHPDCKKSLIAVMPDPAVVTDLTGGHLALLVRPDRYIGLVTGYIKNGGNRNHV